VVERLEPRAVTRCASGSLTRACPTNGGAMVHTTLERCSRWKPLRNAHGRPKVPSGGPKRLRWLGQAVEEKCAGER
jgi:hypothetical protein